MAGNRGMECFFESIDDVMIFNLTFFKSNFNHHHSGWFFFWRNIEIIEIKKLIKGNHHEKNKQTLSRG